MVGDQTQPGCEVLDKTSLLTRPRVMAGEASFWSSRAVSQAYGPSVQTPQILSLFQTSGLIHLQSQIYFWRVLSRGHCHVGGGVQYPCHGFSVIALNPCGLRLPPAAAVPYLHCLLLVLRVHTQRGGIGDRSIFNWCLCFIMNPIILIAEWWELKDRLPFSGEAFCVTFSCCAAVSCLSVSITYPSTIQLSAHGPCQAQIISTTVLSFTASVVYATEVACTGTGTGTWY